MSVASLSGTPRNAKGTAYLGPLISTILLVIAVLVAWPVGLFAFGIWGLNKRRNIVPQLGDAIFVFIGALIICADITAWWFWPNDSWLYKATFVPHLFGTVVLTLLLCGLWNRIFGRHKSGVIFATGR